jgi:hypothetical protein
LVGAEQADFVRKPQGGSADVLTNAGDHITLTAGRASHDSLPPTTQLERMLWGLIWGPILMQSIIYQTYQ